MACLNEYLVFIDDVGTNLDDKFVYQFYFSDRPEVVWGDYWNICPSSIVPHIKPDINSISKIYECELNHKLNLVTNNSCFSMQDCIDQIIALGWFDLDSGISFKDESGNNVMSFKFGEDSSCIEEKMRHIGSEFNNSKVVWEHQDESEDMIDNLIDKLGGEEDGLEW